MRSFSSFGSVRRCGRAALLLALLVLSGSLPVVAAPVGHVPTRRVAVVLVSAVSLEELMHTPTTGIRSLLTTGAVGVMNARTGPNAGGRRRRGIDSLVLHPEEVRPATLEAACLTIGAGTRSFARQEASEAFEAKERTPSGPGAAVWSQRTGMPAGQDAIYQVSLPRLAAWQARLPYPSRPGALGQALRDAGLRAAVIGNADDLSGPHREAACLAIDMFGRVPLGAVGAPLSPSDPTAPGGRATDPAALLREVERALDQDARFLVIETGDTARVDRANGEIQAAIRSLRRRQAIQRADRVVTGLLRVLDPNETLLILVAPAVSLDAARAGNPLAPLVLAGAGVTRGVLYSPSTRTPGLAVITDIAPTILSFLEVPIPAQCVGRPLASRPDTHAPETVLAMEARFRAIEDYARPLARGLVWGQVALFAVFLLSAWVRPGAIHTPYHRAGALALATLPAAVALVALFSPASKQSGTLSLILLIGCLTSIGLLLRRWLSPIGVVWLVGGVALAYDLLTGNELLRASPLGYSPYAGARYYGIGNEGFGLLAPALLLGIVCIVSAVGAKRRPAANGAAAYAILPVIGLILAVLIGHPSLGANFGGGLSAVALAAMAAYLAVRGRVSRKVLIGIVLAGVALAILPVAWETFRGSEQQSHVGRAVELLGREGPLEAVHIVRRKLRMNLMLMRFSPWSRLLLVSGLSLAYLLYHRRERLRARYPLLWQSMLALLAGAAAGLALNDSGVLPAAEMVVAVTAAALYAESGREDGEESKCPSG